MLLIEPDVATGAPGRDAAAAESIPTKANVLARLPGCPIAHFSCHGVSHPADPSKSLLMLHDYATNPLTVASLSTINLHQARVAFLSACSTALTLDLRLLDEAIHLTGAFQLAGFPHVIGTLWEIEDYTASQVAGSFYSHLYTQPGILDTSHAAHALHQAIRSARDTYPVTPSLWAAYLHAGA